MSKIKKVSSERKASEAAQILSDPNSSKIAKKLAGSVLSQVDVNKQTSSEMAKIASKVLKSTKYSNETKSFAGSVLSQANKED